MQNKKLINRILKASNIISNASRKGSANFIVVSPQVADVINEAQKRILREKKIKRILYENINDDNTNTIL